MRINAEPKPTTADIADANRAMIKKYKCRISRLIPEVKLIDSKLAPMALATDYIANTVNFTASI